MNQPQLTTEELQNRVLELHQQNQQLQQQLQQVRPPTIATNPPQLPELLIPMFSGNSTGGTSNFTSFMRQIRLSIGRTDLTAIHPDEPLRGIRQLMSKLQGHASVWGNTIGLDELMDMSLPTFLTLLEDQFSRSDEINDLLENLTCPSEAKVPEFTSEFLLLAASSSFGEEALRRRYMRCLPTALQNCLRAAAPDAIATLQAVGNFAVKQVRHRHQLDSIFQPTGRPPAAHRVVPIISLLPIQQVKSINANLAEVFSITLVPTNIDRRLENHYRPLALLWTLTFIPRMPTMRTTWIPPRVNSNPK